MAPGGICERLGVNEDLKSRDVMAWVQRYGQARGNVRETLQKELEKENGNI